MASGTRCFFGGVESTINWGEADPELADVDGEGTPLREVLMAMDVSIIEVYNGTGVSIAANSLVYFSGSQTLDATIFPTIAKAQATAAGHYAQAITTAAIATGATGFVAKIFDLKNIDTSAGAVDQVVYLSDATAGAYTLTEPTGTDKVQEVGRIVVASATVGWITFDLSSVTVQRTHLHADDAEGGLIVAPKITVTPGANADESLVIAPLGVAAVCVDFKLETEMVSGTVIDADYGGATSLSGALIFEEIDLTTNVTPGAQRVTVFNVLVPATTYDYDGASPAHAALLEANLDNTKGPHIRLDVVHTQDSSFDILLGANKTVANGEVWRGIRVFDDTKILTVDTGETAEGLVSDLSSASVTNNATAILHGLRVSLPAGLGSSSGVNGVTINQQNNSVGLNLAVTAAGTGATPIKVGLAQFQGGSIFSAAYTAAETLTGATTGFALDLSTNVTPADQSILGFALIMPANVSAASAGFSLASTQDQGAGYYGLFTGTIAADQILDGVEIDMDGLTLNSANAVVSGVKVNQSTLTLTLFSEASAFKAIPNSKSRAIYIDQATVDAVGKDLIYADIDVADPGAADFRGAVLNIDETVAGTDGRGIIGYEVDLTGFATGRADLRGYNLVLDGTKNAGDSTIGFYVQSTMTLNNAGETFYGIDLNLAGMTLTSFGTFNAFRADMPSKGTAIYIDQATVDAVGKNLVDIDVDVADPGGSDFQTFYVVLDETVVGTNGRAIVGYGVDITGFATGRADLYGFRANLNGTKNAGDVSRGGQIVSTLTLNNGLETMYGLDIDLSGTVNTSSGIFDGLYVGMPTTYGGSATTEACVYLVGDGSIVEILSGTTTKTIDALNATLSTTDANNSNDGMVIVSNATAVTGGRTHTGRVIDYTSTLESNGANISRQTNPLMNFAINLTETGNQCTMNTGILGATITATGITTPLLYGNMYSFTTTGPGLLSDATSLMTFAQDFNHDDDTADAMRGVVVNWSGDVRGTNATTTLTLFEANFSGELGAGGANGLLRGFYADLSATLTAGVAYGVDVDASAVATAGTVRGVNVQMPPAYGAAAEAAFYATGAGNQVGILQDTYGIYLNVLNATTLASPVLLDMEIFPTGSIVAVSYSVAETLSAALNALDINIGTNITQFGFTPTVLTAVTTPVQDTSNQAVGINLTSNTNNLAGGGAIVNSATGITITMSDNNDVAFADTHTGEFLSLNMVLDNSNAGGSVTRQASAMIDVDVTLTETLGTVSMTTGIMDATIAAPATSPLLSGTMYSFATTGSGVVNAPLTLSYYGQAFDHANLAADALKGIQVVWAGDCGGAFASDLRLLDVGYTGTIGAGGAAASLTGLYVDFDGFTYTNGAVYGARIICDSINQSNPVVGLEVRKGAGGAITAARTVSGDMGSMLSPVTNTGAGFDITNQENGIDVVMSHTMTTTGASSDTFSGTALVIDIDGVTNNASDTLVMSARAVLINYDITETAGAATLNATDIVKVDFGVGAGAAIGGNINMLLLDGDDFDPATNPGAPAVVNGGHIDWSGATITNVAGWTLRGLEVDMPAAYFANPTYAAIRATGNGNTWACLTGDGMYQQMREAASIAYNLDIDVAANTSNDQNGINITHDVNGAGMGPYTHTGYLLNYNAGLAINNGAGSVTRSNALSTQTVTLTATQGGDIAAMEDGFEHYTVAVGGGAGTERLTGDMWTMTLAGTIDAGAASPTLKGMLMDSNITMNDPLAIHSGIEVDLAGVTRTTGDALNGLNILMHGTYTSALTTGDTAISIAGDGCTVGILTGDTTHSVDMLSGILTVADASNGNDVLNIINSLNNATAAACIHDGYLINYQSTLNQNTLAGSVTRQTNPLIGMTVNLSEAGGGSVVMTSGFLSATVSRLAGTPDISGNMFSLTINTNLEVPTASTLRGYYLDSNVILNGATAQFEGLTIDLNGMTVTDASNLVGLSIDLSTATTPDNSDYVAALKIKTPSGRSVALDTSVRGTASGRIEQGAPNFYDEFWGRRQAPQWVLVQPGGGIAGAPPVGLRNGWICYNTTTMVASAIAYDWGAIYDFVSTLRPSFEVRLYIPTVKTTLDVVVGLMDAVTRAVVVGGAPQNAFFAAATGDFVVIQMANTVYGDTNWRLHTALGGANSTDPGAAAASSTEVVVRFEFVSDTSVEWFINGASQGIVNTNVPTAALEPVLYLYDYNATVGGEFLDIGNVKIWQDIA